MLTTKVMSGLENENPGPTNQDVILNIIAFNTKLKHPNVTIVTGNVKRNKIGLTNKFSTARTILATSAATQFVTKNCGTNHAITKNPNVLMAIFLVIDTKNHSNRRQLLQRGALFYAGESLQKYSSKYLVDCDDDTQNPLLEL